MNTEGTCRRARRWTIALRAGCLAFLLGAMPGTGISASLEAPTLKSDSEVATAGFYQLQWSAATVADFELQEATDAGFADARTLYRGPDLATVLSGQPDGDYYYRIRAVDNGDGSPWSGTVHVEVQHHSLARALRFLAVGAIVFVALLILILRGETLTRS